MTRPIVVLLLSVLLPAGIVAQKKPVTIESLTATRPPLPGPAVWAPDGKSFAFQEGKKIWLYDVPKRAKRELLSMDKLEAGARKGPAPEAFDWQNRNVREQTLQWSSSGKELLLSAGGDLFLFFPEPGGWTQLTATPEVEHDPKLSPDGRRVSFRRDHELYSLEISSRKVTRLTQDSSATVWNGELDWVYPEELNLGTAHWWSPDSKQIAYLQFDVSREPLYPHADLLHLHPIAEPQRYPKAGDPNANVRMGVAPAAGGQTRWMDLAVAPDMLLARLAWLPDSQGLLAQRLNRVQNVLDIILGDVRTGSTRRVLEEPDPYWINVHDDLRMLNGGKEFLWSSERDGFRHLYRYSIDGKELAQLTRGEWEVNDVASVDEPGGQIFFVSTEESPLERHLYRVSLNGEGRRRLTQGAGTHAISMGPKCEYYIDGYSSLSEPPRRVIHTSEGKEWAVFLEADRKTGEEYEILPTEIVPVKASDGTLLYARLIKPAGFRSGQKYPAIVMIYGGPGAQTVRNLWYGANFDQVMAHRGFVIWQLDNRGSAGRGHKWESVLFRTLGAKELEDQKEGVRHLISLGFADPARIGIHGSSYGGFMTIYSLLHAPELFRAGAAGAPGNIDWHNYDTIYTERYLGLPSENPEGYRRSSPVHLADKLAGKLLIFHNLEDDNVPFQNTMQMIDALERAGKQFELMLYPQKSHGIAGPARKHMLETVASFFERTLK
ncbi:MAG: S9 family peptidase [Acidobacteria bacterium]|nr:S9 family peptidase [Acidobacteriota bacterium]